MAAQAGGPKGLLAKMLLMDSQYNLKILYNAPPPHPDDLEAVKAYLTKWYSPVKVAANKVLKFREEAATRASLKKDQKGANVKGQLQKAPGATFI